MTIYNNKTIFFVFRFVNVVNSNNIFSFLKNACRRVILNKEIKRDAVPIAAAGNGRVRVPASRFIILEGNVLHISLEVIERTDYLICRGGYYALRALFSWLGI